MEQAAPDTRTALLHAAMACFADTGYEGTSTRMIAERARRPLSLISHYFGNKETLYIEVFQLIICNFGLCRDDQPLTENCSVPRDRSEAIRLLREQIHTVYQESSPEASLNDPMKDAAARLWHREMRCPRPGLHELILKHVGPRNATLRRSIQMLRPELSLSEATFLSSAILGQVISHGLMYGLNKVIWGEMEAPGSPFQASELLVDLCLHGLLRTDSPRS